MDLIGQPIIVLDLETAHSADDCRLCARSLEEHLAGPTNFDLTGRHVGVHRHEPIGWEDKLALGLSIGCWWDYRDSRIHWFDVHMLENTVRNFVATTPLLVSFNGIAFDFPLMRAVLRQEAAQMEYDDHHNATAVWYEKSARLSQLCDDFTSLCATSYDVLAEIWRVDPARKFEHGLNSLDAIAQANGYGAKLSHGAQAPRDWREGRYAQVLNYYQDDVLKTKSLFEQIVDTGTLLRGDGQSIRLRCPLDLVEG